MVSRMIFLASLTQASHRKCRLCRPLFYNFGKNLPRLFYFPGCKLLFYPGAFNMTTGPAHWELLVRNRYTPMSKTTRPTIGLSRTTRLEFQVFFLL